MKKKSSFPVYAKVVMRDIFFSYEIDYTYIGLVYMSFFRNFVSNLNGHLITT